MCDENHFYVNPTGRFVIGGPDGDAGLTGRKIIVDTYGGAAPHGGGAFSGKDPSKVDRSAAYAARYLAKNVVAAGLAARCTIQLSYAIGVSHPLSVYVDTHGTGQVDEEQLSNVLQQLMDLSPRGIRKHLQLNRPIYARTAAYGHFGREPEPDGGFLGAHQPRRGSAERVRGAVRSALGEMSRGRPRYYGRRLGRSLRSTQRDLLASCLPTFGLSLPAEGHQLDPRLLFPSPPAEIWLEIGFGAGEHLIGQALARPDVGCIGCEPYINGVATLLARVRSSPSIAYAFFRTRLACCSTVYKMGASIASSSCFRIRGRSGGITDAELSDRKSLRRSREYFDQGASCSSRPTT